MHPFLQNRQRVLLYIAVWTVVGLGLAAPLVYLAGLAPTAGMALAVPYALDFGIICLTAIWVCRSLPLDGTPPSRLALGWGAAALQASAVGTAFAALLAVVLTRTGLLLATRDQILAGGAVTFLLGIPLYFGSLVIHYLLLTFEASRATERRLLESQVGAREAEVRALRAQLNPHFLFNSLNSINSLVGGDPEAARRMCENLGEFLRRTLALGARDAVSLDEELALVDRYFAIERVRFGERLQVERYIESGAERCMVPPLLLQPLVENAIKHGVATRVEGGTVKLAAVVVDGMLRVSVENELDEDAPKRSGQGVGLQNVRSRLDALSARDTRLDTYREEGRFRVTMTLPARLGTAPQPAAAHA